MSKSEEFAKEVIENGEEWRKIDFPFDRYSVSDLGRVRNDEIDHVFNINGGIGIYPYVKLRTRNGDRKRWLNHVLVAKMFLDYDKEKQKDKQLVVHHINKDKSDARLCNLSVVTSSENAQQTGPRDNGCRRKVWQLDMEGNFIKEWPSAIDVSSKWNGKISEVCLGVQNSSHGYKWAYPPEIDLEGELWKQIEYKGNPINVSDYGRIEKSNGMKIFGHTDRYGYLVVGINNQRFPVHQLVCYAWHLKDYRDGLVVNHINHIKIDNRANNLEWVTTSENAQAYVATKPDFMGRQLLRKPVVAIKEDEIIHFVSISEAARQMGPTHGHINNVVCGRKNTAWGYKYMYKEDFDKMSELECVNG